jgi:hypothetical protein
MDTAAGSGFLTPNLDVCDDGFGYKGFDYLSELTFINVKNDGVISKGQAVPFVAQINSDCRAWGGAYTLDVSLISPAGQKIAGVTGSETYTYQDKYSSSLLSYCSTETCGRDRINGMIQIPQDAPAGKYTVAVHIGAGKYNSANTNMSYNMSEYLSVPLSASDLPAVQGLSITAVNSGVLTCSLGDSTSQAVQNYGVTGTDWTITEDGNVIDQKLNFPLATDAVTLYPASRGTFASGLFASSPYRVYGYSFRSQKKGSTYSCSVQVHSTFGVGGAATVSQVATVSASDFTAIGDPSPTATPTPTTSPSAVPSDTPTPTASATPLSSKLQTIYCLKSKSLKKITGKSPKCPSGYKLIQLGK